MWHSQTRYFTPSQTQRDLENWVNSFADTFVLDQEWVHRTINAANKMLEESFHDGKFDQLCLEVSTNPSECIRAVFPQEQKIYIRERREFNHALDTYNLKHMKSGESGPIRFHLVSCDSEEITPRIIFDELERAIVLDSSEQRFRRCFTLANDFSLDAGFTISAASPVEERLLVVNHEKIQANPISAVVSLLTQNYAATAFRVAPQGMFLTCHHNLYFQDGANQQETVYLHNEAASFSNTFAKNNKRIAVVQRCDLPSNPASAIDPLEETERSSGFYIHADVATIYSDLPGCFLIPDATELSLNLPVICVGYPRKIELKRIQEAYIDLLPYTAVPDLEDYNDIFKLPGVLSVSPGPVCGYNNHVVAAQVSTTPGFSGAPICLMENPRLFVAVHYRVRRGKNYELSVSVRDPAFYKLYSETVVPFLRIAELSQDDKRLINIYLSTCGSTPPLQ